MRFARRPFSVKAKAASPNGKRLACSITSSNVSKGRETATGPNGSSFMHGDHIGQAAQFTNARLFIGKRDFQMLEGKPNDTLKGWRTQGKPVTLISNDTDVFGDGSVVALHLPGHTPDHLALLVNLESGPVLLSGDLYHSTIAREKKAVPGFNSSREQTLASMDKFEAIARKTGAKVIIQHEPNDIAKLPSFPQAAE